MKRVRQETLSYTSVPAHRKSQLQMCWQTRRMTQGMWRAKQSPASLKRGLSKVVGQLQLRAAAALNVSGWRARTAPTCPTCPLRPSLWFDAQSCLLIDLHLPAAVACGRVCIAFALSSPRAVRLSDKSVRRREKKKWYARRDVSTPAVVVAGGQCLTALCFTPSPAIRDDTPYRGACVRLASGYEEDVAGDRVIKLSPGGSAAYVSHALALSGSWPSFIGKKRSHEWKTWICPLDTLSLKLSGWLPVGHRCICAWVNVRRCSAVWLSRRLLRYFTQREMVSQRSPAAHPPSLHHQEQLCGAQPYLLRLWRRINSSGNNELESAIKWLFFKKK